MALPGSTTTTSVMGATITGAFNQRDVEVKERLKLKLTKRTVQNLAEQQPLAKDQQKKSTPATAKKPPTNTNAKAKECLSHDKNDIDDLVRFIDGGETTTSNTNDTHTASTAATSGSTQESTSKKNKKKKDKQAKANPAEDVKAPPKEQPQKKQNGTTPAQPTAK